jgi:predicted ester cyclase
MKTAMKTVADPVARTRAAAESYFQAWVARDLERILSHHTTPETAFVLHGVAGVQNWQGVDAVRQAFDFLLRAMPDQTFDVRSMVVREDLIVAHSLVTATLVLPFPLAGRTYQPSGRPIRFEIVDIWHFDGDRIRVKEGWVDAMALHNQLQVADG